MSALCHKRTFDSYSINSSARPDRGNGTVMPSACLDEIAARPGRPAARAYSENELSSRTDATLFLFERWGTKTSKLFVNCLRNREGEHVATARADDLNARRQTLSIQPG